MKKKFLVVILVLLLVGCGSKKALNSNDIKKRTEKNVSLSDEESVQVVDPIKIGLYISDGEKKKILDEYSPVWRIHEDLCSLEIYYTDEKELISDNQKVLWRKYYDGYNDIRDYKLGINIKFDTTDGPVNDLILSPKDTEKSVSMYVLMYLYDDINNSNYYSHLTEEDLTDETVVTSVKLTAGTYYNNISSDIQLDVFMYGKKDFDDNNNYVGNSKYTLFIKKPN